MPDDHRVAIARLLQLDGVVPGVRAAADDAVGKLAEARLGRLRRCRPGGWSAATGSAPE